MCWKIVWFVFITVLSGSQGLTCYNCSTTHRENGPCAGDFVTKTDKSFHNSKIYLVNCTGENAMCFVRAWTSRAHHSWLVQRGCYQPIADDPLPLSLNIPTRAMTCKHEKYAEAEYRVCLCTADWCNTDTRLTSPNLSSLVLITLVVIIIIQI